MAQASTATAPPVMDVVAPPSDNDRKNETPPPLPTEPTETQDPLDRLVAEDQREQQAHTEEKTKPHEKPARHAQSAQPKDTPRAASISMAITATVIIVLGLAALATYAYMQTNS